MRILLLTILLSLICVSTGSGETKSLYYDLGARGYELVLDMQYDEAERIFDEMIRMEPENAAGYIYKSQSFFHYWKYTFITPDQKSLKNFKSLLFKTKTIAEKMPDRDNIVTSFTLGSAYGNIGLYYANTNKWLRAFWYGRKGIRYVREAVNKDPEYYNAYYLLGMYNYYAATLPKVVKSLSFLLGSPEGDRDKGIQQLILASSKGDLKGDAKIFLADSVYFHERNFEAASALLRKLIKKYPNNHYISLALGISYRNLGRYDLSARILTSSSQAESIKKFPTLHGYLYYNLGVVYSRMNKYDQAVSAQKMAFDISKNLKGSMPDQYEAWSLYEIGNAYEMLGKNDMAREYYSMIKENNKSAYKNAQARIKNPLTPAHINLTRGINYLRYKKYPQAEEILRELVKTELDKESVDNTFKAEACIALGELEYHLKNYRNSIETLKRVFTYYDVRKDWIKPWSHYWLASCYSETGDTEKAEQEYDKAYEYNDDRLRLKIDQERSRMETPMPGPEQK